MSHQGDIFVKNEGSIVLFILNTPDAYEWWLENVEPNSVDGPRRKVVEHRYAADFITGLLKAGFTLEEI
jgi:hypothetical protein